MKEALIGSSDTDHLSDLPRVQGILRSIGPQESIARVRTALAECSSKYPAVIDLLSMLDPDIPEQSPKVDVWSLNLVTTRMIEYSLVWLCGYFKFFGVEKHGRNCHSFASLESQACTGVILGLLSSMIPFLCHS